MKDGMGYIGGYGDVYLLDKDGEVVRYVGRFHNVVTDNARERFLGTILNAVAGEKLDDTTHQMVEMLFLSGDLPDDIATDDLNANGASVEGNETLSVPADITTVAGSHCSGQVSATWTNGSGGDVTITFFSCTESLAGSTDADLQYAVVNIDDTVVIDGQSLSIYYTLQINYDTEYAPI